MFPLGGMTKTEVRALAEEFDLPVAKKHESYEICFVPNGDYAGFMDAYLREKGVEREATSGPSSIPRAARWALMRRASLHGGAAQGLWESPPAEPLYVIATDPQSQTVTVGRTTRCCAPG
jgi:tRNA-uridine 2-sulfurtransferase